MRHGSIIVLPESNRKEFDKLDQCLRDHAKTVFISNAKLILEIIQMGVIEKKTHAISLFQAIQLNM